MVLALNHYTDHSNLKNFKLMTAELKLKFIRPLKLIGSGDLLICLLAKYYDYSIALSKSQPEHRGAPADQVSGSTGHQGQV